MFCNGHNCLTLIACLNTPMYPHYQPGGSGNRVRGGTEMTGYDGDDPVTEVQELDRQLYAWPQAHPAWSQVYWPDYRSEPGTEPMMFRVRRSGTGQLILGGNIPRFLAALGEACIDGRCGVDHSGDDPISVPAQASRTGVLVRK